MPKRTTSESGRLGEEETVARLKKAGCDILARNYRCVQGELDIVAKKGDTILFVEVKARAKGALAPPACAVDQTKRRRLVKSAMQFLYAHREYENLQPRFDVAEVIFAHGDSFRVLAFDYLKHAFTLDDIGAK